MNEVLYTEPRWKNVNASNKKLMQEYLRSLVANKLRPNTIREYGYDLRFFLTWNLLYNDNMSVLYFKKRHFNDYKFFLIENRNCSNARVNRILSAIRQMMSYAEDDDDEYEDYVRNVAVKIKGLEKNPKRDIAFITDDQVLLLRRYLKNNEMYKHLFLLDVLYDSGARINEVYQLKDGSMETADKGYIKVICKGGRAEYILLHDRSKESLRLYLDQLQGKSIWNTVVGSVAKDADTIRGWVRELYKILKELDDTTPYFTAHSFRHSMIENLINGSHYVCDKIGRAFTIEEVALLVHHKSTDMTNSYRRPQDDRLMMELFGIKIG